MIKLYLRDAKERITRQTAIYIALGISRREKIGDFNPYDEWLSKYLERNKF